ncbi:MAG TPA: alginate lyase family protein, partial [Caldilineaceae bacterium]|nr:alginate lyase family protein [Caldilineaceae bacterium]
QVNIRNYQWLWDVAEAYDIPVPAAFRDGLEAMHGANLKLMMPDGCLPDLNDGGWHPVDKLLERAVSLYPARTDFRWAVTGGGQGSPPDYTSIALDYAGLYVMRSGWDAQAVWALLDGGPFGFAHQHEDKLNFLLHAYGRRLITEGGNYAYDDSPMRRYVLSTRSHNTARVDGQDQNRRRSFDRVNERIDRPSGTLWHSDEARDVVEAVYTEGYGPDAERTVSHRRRVTFYKEGAERFGPCFLVEDTFTPTDDAEHSYEILWHLHTGAPAVEGLAVRSVDAGLANVALIPEDPPEGLLVEIVTGQEEPEWQGWHAVKDHQQGEYEACPTAIYRLRGAGIVRIVLWIVPIQTLRTN